MSKKTAKKATTKETSTKKSTKSTISKHPNKITTKVSLPSNWDSMTHTQQRGYLKEQGVGKQQRSAYLAHSNTWFKNHGYIGTGVYSMGGTSSNGVYMPTSSGQLQTSLPSNWSKMTVEKRQKWLNTHNFDYAGYLSKNAWDQPNLTRTGDKWSQSDDWTQNNSWIIDAAALKGDQKVADALGLPKDWENWTVSQKVHWAGNQHSNYSDKYEDMEPGQYLGKAQGEPGKPGSDARISDLARAYVWKQINSGIGGQGDSNNTRYSNDASISQRFKQNYVRSLDSNGNTVWNKAGQAKVDNPSDAYSAYLNNLANQSPMPSGERDDWVKARLDQFNKMGDAEQQRTLNSLGINSSVGSRPGYNGYNYFRGYTDGEYDKDQKDEYKKLTAQSAYRNASRNGNNGGGTPGGNGYGTPGTGYYGDGVVNGYGYDATGGYGDYGDYGTDDYTTTQNPQWDLIRRQYQTDMNNLYLSRMNYLGTVRDNTIGTARDNYNGKANSAYITYRQNTAKRRTMASNLGMTGGGTENMRVGDESNYNNSLANINAGKNTAYTNARNAYADAENNARVSRDSAIAGNQAELAQAEINYNQSQAQFERQQAAQRAQWETENNYNERALQQQQSQDAISNYYRQKELDAQTNSDLAKAMGVYNLTTGQLRKLGLDKNGKPISNKSKDTGRGKGKGNK